MGKKEINKMDRIIRMQEIRYWGLKIDDSLIEWGMRL